MTPRLTYHNAVSISPLPGPPSHGVRSRMCSAEPEESTLPTFRGQRLGGRRGPGPSPLLWCRDHEGRGGAYRGFDLGRLGVFVTAVSAKTRVESSSQLRHGALTFGRCSPIIVLQSLRYARYRRGRRSEVPQRYGDRTTST